MHLVVVTAFADKSRGDVIVDETEIQAALKEHPEKVVAVITTEPKGNE